MRILLLPAKFLPEHYRIGTGLPSSAGVALGKDWCRSNTRSVTVPPFVSRLRAIIHPREGVFKNHILTGTRLTMKKCWRGWNMGNWFMRIVLSPIPVNRTKRRAEERFMAAVGSHRMYSSPQIQ